MPCTFFQIGDYLLFFYRLLNTESHQREEARELAIVQRKMALLDTANSELVAQLLKLKYKTNMTKSTTCDNMLSSL